MAKHKRNFKKWLNKKFRLVLYLSDSLEAKWTFRFSRIGMVILNLSLLALLLTVFWLLVVHTSIKERIPGYPDSSVKEHMITNKIRIDSLEEELRMRDQYLEVIKGILLGIDSVDNNYLFPAGNLGNDSLSRAKSELAKGGIWVNQSFKNPFPSQSVINLYPPLKGFITNAFNPAMKHFGTDIVAVDDITVKAARTGIVISANFTVETGYSIVIQHDMGIVTIYRHNNKVMVKAGDKVVAGQVIAVMGNTGELSSGEHLHFEVWIDGNPVNPEDYTQFTK